MATNIVTSDGKDLDSRYLGINAKAASAGYADSAGSATNANYATSAGTATNVTNKGSISRNGAPVYTYISSVSRIQAAVTGIAFAGDSGASSSDKGIYNQTASSERSPRFGCFVNKGDWIMAPGNATVGIVIYPVKIG